MYFFMLSLLHRIMLTVKVYTLYVVKTHFFFFGFPLLLLFIYFQCSKKVFCSPFSLIVCYLICILKKQVSFRCLRIRNDVACSINLRLYHFLHCFDCSVIFSNVQIFLLRYLCAFCIAIRPLNSLPLSLTPLHIPPFTYLFIFLQALLPFSFYCLAMPVTQSFTLT